MYICVFCSSSDAAPRKYFVSAERLGREIVSSGYHLVYGGANRGLMSTVAESVQKNGGKVIGVIPKALKQYGIAKKGLDELIITTDLRQRKKIMEQKASAFIFMPGGVGTLEEAMEILTLKQLRYHQKPLIFLNTGGFYNKLMKFFRVMEKEKFIKEDLYRMFYLAKNEKDAIEYIKKYKPEKLSDKWF